MLCKYYLHIGSDKVDIASDDCMEVGGMVANLSDLTVSYKRTDYGGVVRSCGSEIEFIGNARETLIALWRSQGVNCKAAFAVYVADENWVYSPLWECPLDFATLSYDSHYCRVGCVDTSAAALIKANRGTRYHYGAVGLSENARLDYDRVQMQNEAVFKSVTGTGYEGNARYTQFTNNDGSNIYCFFPMVLMSEEGIAPGQNVFVLADEMLHLNSGIILSDDSGYYFAQCLIDTNYSIDLTGMRVRTQFSGYLRFVFVVYRGSDNHILRKDVAGVDVGGGWYEYGCPFKGNFYIEAGEKISVRFSRCENGTITNLPTGTYLLYNGDCKMQWKSMGEHIGLRVIRPVTLLNRLLESIGGDRLQIRGEIDDADNERLRNTMLLPAEEIRGFSGPTLYSSFKQFCDFMEVVYGYVYEIEDAEVTETVTDALCVLPFASSVESVSFEMEGSEDLVVDEVRYVENEGRFYGFKNSRYYYMWKGCMDYNDVVNNYRAYAGKIYYELSTCNAFTYEEDAEGETVGRLASYSLEDIYEPYYDKLKGFAGFVDGERDNHGYEGQIDENDIFYDRTAKMFFCKDQTGNYYSEWDGSEDYNDGSGVRAKSAFYLVGTETAYVLVQGAYLMKYEDLPEIDPMESAAIVRFKHRTKVFTGVVALVLDSVGEPDVSVAGDRLFSELKMGYEKQDYDLGNSGNDEWNFNNVYTTGNQLSDKRLEMICPYRADCYGIEEAAGKRGQETSSSDSDSDLFMVKVLGTLSGGLYQIDRSLTITGAYTDTVFNGTYTPFFCLMENKEFLASFSWRYRYASSEGNTEVYVDGYSNKRTVQLDTNAKLFDLMNVRVKTGEQTVPVPWSRLVQFDWQGRRCKGYVNSVTFNPQRPEVVEYELLEKEVATV